MKESHLRRNSVKGTPQTATMMYKIRIFTLKISQIKTQLRNHGSFTLIHARKALSVHNCHLSIPASMPDDPPKGKPSDTEKITGTSAIGKQTLSSSKLLRGANAENEVPDSTFYRSLKQNINQLLEGSYAAWQNTRFSPPTAECFIPFRIRIRVSPTLSSALTARTAGAVRPALTASAPTATRR